MGSINTLINTCTSRMISLPKHEVLVDRLKKADEDTYRRQKVSLFLLDEAGSTKALFGVVQIVNWAFDEYVRKSPVSEQSRLLLLASPWKPKYLEALIIEDPEALKTAQDLLRFWDPASHVEK